MSSVYKMYLKKCLLITFIVYIVPLGIMLYDMSISDSLDKFSGFFTTTNTIYTYSFYSTFISLLIGVAVLYLYFYMYNEKYNSLQSQFPITTFQRFITPVITLLLPGVFLDIYAGYLNLEEVFFIVYIKYFIVSFGILFAATARNRRRLVILVSLASIATILGNNLVIGNMLTTLAFNYFNIFIVLIGLIVPLVLAYIIHVKALKNHNYELLSKVYYLELVLITSIFFTRLFINKYPFRTDLVGIKIGDYSFSVFFYIITLIAIIVLVYYKYQKIDFKKILALCLPVVLVSIFYVASDLFSEKSDVTCKYYESRVKKSNGISYRETVEISGASSLNFGADIIETSDILLNRATTCIKSYAKYSTSSDMFDLDALAKKNEAIANYRGVNFLIKKDPHVITEMLDNVKNPNMLNYISTNIKGIEYRAFYLPKSLDKDKVNQIKEVLNNTVTHSKNFQTIYLDDKEGIDLFNNIIINQDENYIEDNELILSNVNIKDFDQTKKITVDEVLDSYIFSHEHNKLINYLLKGGN